MRIVRYGKPGRIKISSLYASLLGNSCFISVIMLYVAGLIFGCVFAKRIYEQILATEYINEYRVIFLISELLSLILIYIIYCSGLSLTGKSALYVLPPLIGIIYGVIGLLLIAAIKQSDSILPSVLLIPLNAMKLCCYFTLIRYSIDMCGSLRLCLENGREVPELKDYRIRTVIVTAVISVLNLLTSLIK